MRRLLIMFVLLLISSTSHAGVINHDTTAVSAVASAVSTRTVSVVVNSGTNRLLVCGTGARGNSASNLVTSGFTFNGAPLTKIREDVSGSVNGEFAGTSLWYLLAPTVGSASAVVTWTGNISNVATAWCGSYSGVDQTTPIGPSDGSTNNTGTSLITTSVTPLLTNAYVIDSVYSGNDGSNTVGAGQTARSNRVVTGGSTDQTSVSTKGPIGTPASTGMSWTPDGVTFYAQSVAVLNSTH